MKKTLCSLVGGLSDGPGDTLRNIIPKMYGACKYTVYYVIINRREEQDIIIT